MKTFLAIAALAISSTALAMGVPPSAADEETAANKLVPQGQLVEVRIAAQTITTARRLKDAIPAEVSATAAHEKAANAALNNAVQARRALDLAEYKKQAAIVFAKKAEACAILSGC